MRQAFFVAFLAPALVLSAVARADQLAGVSAAVRGSIALTRGTAVGQRVASGEEIFLGDAIESGPKSGMQVLLLDETVFTIGPDSKLTIDKFVYDPATGAGELSAEVAKGVFRFVSGKVAENNPNAMKVRVPSGNLGIRGTIVGGEIQPEGTAVVFLLGEGPNNDLGAKASSFDVENAGVSVEISRPGWGAELAPNQPPIRVRVPELVIQAATDQLNDPGEGSESGEPSGDRAEATAEPGKSQDGDSPKGKPKADGKQMAKPTGPKPAANQQDGKPGKPQGGKAPGPKPLLMGGAPGPPPLAPPGAPLGPNGIPILPPLPPLPSDLPDEMNDVMNQITLVGDLINIPSGIAQYSGTNELLTAGLSDGSYDFLVNADFGLNHLDATFNNIVSGVHDMGIGGMHSSGMVQVQTAFDPDSSNSGFPAHYTLSSTLSASECGTGGMGCTANVQINFSGGPEAGFTSHVLEISDDVNSNITAGAANDVPGVFMP